ncbi:HD domain-containing protein [Agrobacterium sp. CG674]
MPRYSTHGEAMIQRAKAFATGAHSAIDQKRKYTDEDYIVHPQAVAALIGAIPDHTWQQVVLAWLHDTVEDTKVTIGVIRDVFGSEIADQLWYLTNVDKSAGNRAARHTLNCDRLATAPDRVKTVKVADIYDNIGNIVTLDPVFAPQYLKEKEHAMQSLRGADAILWGLTLERILKFQKELLLAA